MAKLHSLKPFHIPAKHTEEGPVQCEDVSVSLTVKCRLLHSSESFVVWQQSDFDCLAYIQR